MELVISPSGEVTTIYNEVLNLAALGPQRIKRASHVEPDASGRWFAQIIDGPVLGPFDRRSDAITAEIAWLTDALRQPTTHAGVH
jgi:hypothetical protein